jgi:hypothetical protein|tara:strand:+ start:412 stop:612 length:201 start_codon:yes stop_codon:yes gene_type:complete
MQTPNEQDENAHDIRCAKAPKVFLLIKLCPIDLPSARPCNGITQIEPKNKARTINMGTRHTANSGY